MSVAADVAASVAQYSCPIRKEGCPGPVVMKESGKLFLVCYQAAERKHGLENVIDLCGHEFPALLFASFMASGRK